MKQEGDLVASEKDMPFGSPYHIHAAEDEGIHGIVDLPADIS